MARLHVYDASSERSGYHLKGWTKSKGNTTLQVRYPARLLFDWLGFEEDEKIPDELLTALLKANLLYTKNSSDEAIREDLDWLESIDVLDAHLTSTQRERLLGFMREYDGPRQKYVDQLRTELDSGESISNDARLSSHSAVSANWRAVADERHGASDSLVKIADEIYGDTSALSDQEINALLDDWLTDTTDADEIKSITGYRESIEAVTNLPIDVEVLSTTDNSLMYIFEETTLSDFPEKSQTCIATHNPDDGEYGSLAMTAPGWFPDPMEHLEESGTVIHNCFSDGDATHWLITFGGFDQVPSQCEIGDFERQIQILYPDLKPLMQDVLDRRLPESTTSIQKSTDAKLFNQ
jgi:hypothetical protein